MRARAAVAALLTGALAIGFVELMPDDPEKPLASEPVLGPARLARARDGGRAYVVDTDAGLRTLPQSTHVRARRNDGSCLIREPLSDGGFAVPRYFGDMNRFPRAWAVGAGCEEVAAVVDDVADSDKDESELLGRPVQALPEAGK